MSYSQEKLTFLVVQNVIVFTTSSDMERSYEYVEQSAVGLGHVTHDESPNTSQIKTGVIFTI